MRNLIAAIFAVIRFERSFFRGFPQCLANHNFKASFCLSGMKSVPIRQGCVGDGLYPQKSKACFFTVFQVCLNDVPDRTQDNVDGDAGFTGVATDIFH